ncbi:MAG: hypothetical protein Q9160_006464 [Pyrenula sp. 1 TL-2023]
MSNSPAWIEMSRRFSHEVISVAVAMKRFHPLLRPIVRWFVPEMRMLGRCWREGRHLMGEFTEKVNRSECTRDAVNEDVEMSEEQKPQDGHRLSLFQWYRDNIGRGEWGNVNRQAHMQLMASFAAVHTTAITLTQTMFELASLPHSSSFQEELRKEVHSVMREYGGMLEGKASVHKLWKADSLLKETQRHNPPGFASFFRYVRKPVTLSPTTHTGAITLPAGTTVICASQPISMDPSSTSYTSPEAFDPLRFYRLRDPRSGIYQFTNITLSSLPFGHGRHACPGRFFAADVARVVVGLFADGWDVALEEGQTKRPKNVVTGVNNLLPPQEGRVRVRKRVDAGVV